MFDNQTVFFVSLGCSKNLVDGETMLGQLAKMGFEIVETPEEAELIVVNTCGFINDAKEESVNAILDMIDYKEQNCKCLVVSGCLAQRYAEELKAEIPEIDAIIGTGEYQHIGDVVEKFTVDQSVQTLVSEPKYINTEDDERINTSPFYSAWLKISEGCVRNCAYCIIPKLRGKLRSRTVESLVAEAKDLVASGVRELNVISQDTSLYGIDLPKENNLVRLLDELEKIEDLEWIRLFYIYPDDLTDEVIEKMASSKKICHYLDIPIQHFSDKILKAMNRKIRGHQILERVNKLRTLIPDIVLRTSLMVGFPGETEEDFETLLNGIRTAKFDHVGIFAFSPEEGTTAATMDHQLVESVKLKRQKIAYEVQEEVVDEMNDKLIGKTIKVLVEGNHPDTDLLISGRYFGQAPDIDGNVIINDLNDRQIQIGDFVDVKISEVIGLDVVGAVV